MKVASELRPRLAIALILLARLALGLTYSLVTPLWESYDEPGHYPYVRHIARHWSLPPREGVAKYHDESCQPPLYYLLGALASFWVETSDYQEPEWNPFFETGTAEGGANMTIHRPQAEAFPYQGTALAAHMARLASILIGIVAVYLTYLLAQTVFPQRQDIGLAAMAIAAFLPHSLFIGAVVTNDVLVGATTSAGLIFSVRIAAHGPKLKELAALGLSLGVGLLAKLNAVALLPLALVALAMAANQERRPLPLFLRSAFVVLGLAAGISGWWYMRNLLVFRSFLPIPSAAETSACLPPSALASRRELLSWGTLAAGTLSACKTFWGAFGWGNIPLGPWAYRFLELVSAFAAVGLALFLIKAEPLPRQSLALLLLLVILTTALMFSWALYSRNPSFLHGRFLLPALSAVALLLATGLAHLVPGPLTWLPLGVVAGAMFLLGAISPFRYIAPAYAPPKLLSAQEISRIQHRLDFTYGGKMELLGYDLREKALKPGDTLHLALYWRAREKMEVDYAAFVHLLGRDEELLGQRIGYPGRGMYPTTLWKAGDTVRDTYTIPIGREAQAPSRLQIEAGLTEYFGPGALAVVDRAGNKLSLPIIAQAKILPAEPPSYQPQRQADFNFAGKVALFGYDVANAALGPTDTLHLTLYWQVLEGMDRDYTVFTHLLDREGRVWAQDDSQPLRGNYPTSLWGPGERLRDEYHLRLKADAPGGDYRLEVGFYLLSTGERLPVLDALGRPGGDHAIIGSITVRGRE